PLANRASKFRLNAIAASALSRKGDFRDSWTSRFRQRSSAAYPAVSDGQAEPGIGEPNALKCGYLSGYLTVCSNLFIGKINFYTMIIVRLGMSNEVDPK